MAKYKCVECGYEGAELVFTMNEYRYCVASNGEEPEYVSAQPDWVEPSLGEAEIKEPVGCPKCHAWGVGKFELV